VPSRYFLAAAAGLLLAQVLPGQEPARLEVDQGTALTPRVELSANQQTANAIAAQLQKSGRLHQYRIEVAFQNGIADLTGMVSDATQRDEAVRLAHGVAGVAHVHDHLTVAGSGVVPCAQAQPPAEEPVPAPRTMPGAPGYPPPGIGMPAQPANGGYANGEPVPIFQVPTPSPYDLNPPKMPPYAWPTYAPYDNYSRVAYPEAYPYQSWPFIGPPYPFPKVPLGWRKVQLQWQDGHWWFSKVGCPYDWWRLRYW
jgi:hypothetical protein